MRNASTGPKYEVVRLLLVLSCHYNAVPSSTVGFLRKAPGVLPQGKLPTSQVSHWAVYEVLVQIAHYLQHVLQQPECPGATHPAEGLRLTFTGYNQGLQGRRKARLLTWSFARVRASGRQILLRFQEWGPGRRLPPGLQWGRG